MQPATKDHECFNRMIKSFKDWIAVCGRLGGPSHVEGTISGVFEVAALWTAPHGASVSLGNLGLVCSADGWSSSCH